MGIQFDHPWALAVLPVCPAVVYVVWHSPAMHTSIADSRLIRRRGAGFNEARITLDAQTGPEDPQRHYSRLVAARRRAGRM